MINNHIIKIYLIFIFLFLVQTGFAQNKNENQDQRGSTFSFEEEKDLIEVGVAPVYVPPVIQEKQNLYKPSQIDASLFKPNKVDLYIPAAKHFAVKFNHQTKSLDFIVPELDNPISSTVVDAIDKAPDWLVNDLELVFSQLTSQYQEKWAQAILDAQDPYIDEIAFTIAHLSPKYLSSDYAYTELVTMNARLIYENDSDLDYVEVVDYGSSNTDPNYYSTTKYRKAVYLDTIEVEVPKDIYYWYIVHPKISDEIPAFIDPAILEYRHYENITNSGNGYFWRDYLYNHADQGYAVLKDMLSECKVIWNKYGESLPGIHSQALDAMNRWMNGSLRFTSNDERPHQPVRIYKKHIGRCGEYGDMRTAIARTALIPCTNVATYSQDHVWNEFWDESWIHWDGYIDDPFMYIDDPAWNKPINSVFSWRGDGSFASVTQRYVRQYATLNIYALDSLANPIDGAMIILYAPGVTDGSPAFDNYGITDTEGKVTFIIGAGRTYWARMQCDYGSVPSNGGLLRVVSTSFHGETYTVSMNSTAKKPILIWNDIPVPQSADKEFLLEVNVSIPNQVIRGRNYYDDLGTATHYISQPQGKFNFFITDSMNYYKYLANEDFQGFYSSNGSLNGKINFEFDKESDWYCVFDNSNSLHTLQHISGTANLYKMFDRSIPQVRIKPNFPNPLVPQSGINTNIVFQLPQKSKVELAIFDVLGQKIRTLVREVRYAGEFNVQWDGNDDLHQPVASGIYFCKIKTDKGVASRRIVVMK